MEKTMRVLMVIMLLFFGFNETKNDSGADDIEVQARIREQYLVKYRLRWPRPFENLKPAMLPVVVKSKQPMNDRLQVVKRQSVLNGGRCLDNANCASGCCLYTALGLAVCVAMATPGQVCGQQPFGGITGGSLCGSCLTQCCCPQTSFQQCCPTSSCSTNVAPTAVIPSTPFGCTLCPTGCCCGLSCCATQQCPTVTQNTCSPCPTNCCGGSCCPGNYPAPVMPSITQTATLCASSTCPTGCCCFSGCCSSQLCSTGNMGSFGVQQGCSGCQTGCCYAGSGQCCPCQQTQTSTPQIIQPSVQVVPVPVQASRCTTCSSACCCGTICCPVNYCQVPVQPMVTVAPVVQPPVTACTQCTTLCCCMGSCCSTSNCIQAPVVGGATGAAAQLLGSAFGEGLVGSGTMGAGPSGVQPAPGSSFLLIPSSDPSGGSMLLPLNSGQAAGTQSFLQSLINGNTGGSGITVYVPVPSPGSASPLPPRVGGPALNLTLDEALRVLLGAGAPQTITPGRNTSTLSLSNATGDTVPLLPFLSTLPLVSLNSSIIGQTKGDAVPSDTGALRALLEQIANRLAAQQIVETASPRSNAPLSDSDIAIYAALVRRLKAQSDAQQRAVARNNNGLMEQIFLRSVIEKLRQEAAYTRNQAILAQTTNLNDWMHGKRT